ncbi:hypothetical protein JL722_7603 [Aureococcus anophagefferens]|nr:hypothetical protein JL722_7603 [Aureococcus anophagefferens]
MARHLLLLLAASAVALLAPAPPVARGPSPLSMGKTVGASSRAFTKTGPRKPQSPRPEQYPDESKLAKRLPFKSSEFRELRKFVARLKTQQRQDELRAQGVDLKEARDAAREATSAKRERQDTARAENRARLMARSEEQEAAKKAAAQLEL